MLFGKEVIEEEKIFVIQENGRILKLPRDSDFT